MLILKILSGSQKGKTFNIGKEEMLIGQDDSNHIIIKEAEIEAKHAVLFTLGDMCFIRDLKSKNGTFVNNKKVQEDILDVGDKVKIGNVELSLEEAVAVAGKDGAKDIQYEEGDEEAPEVMELDSSRKKSKDATSQYPAEVAYRNLSALCHFSGEMAEGRDHEHLMQHVIKVLNEALAADNIYIFLKDKHGDLVPKATFEKEKVKIAPVSREIIRRSLKGKTVMTTDAASDSRFRDNLSIVRRKVKAVICSPMVSRQQTLGVIYIGGSGAVHMFTEQDMELVTSLARFAAVAIDNLRAHRKQSRLLMNMMKSLVTTMELALPNSRGHAIRVANYAGAIAQQKALSSQQVYLCQLGGYLHDVGKIITKTNDKGGDDQKRAYQEHVTAGEKIVLEMEGMQDLLPAIKYHHEYFDGSGFPENLKGEQLPMIARVVGLANYFDHLLTDKRDNGSPLELKEALKELKELAGKKFAPEDVMALREVCRHGEIKVVSLPFVVGMEKAN